MQRLCRRVWNHRCIWHRTALAVPHRTGATSCRSGVNRLSCLRWQAVLSVQLVNQVKFAPFLDDRLDVVSWMCAASAEGPVPFAFRCGQVETLLTTGLLLLTFFGMVRKANQSGKRIPLDMFRFAEPNGASAGLLPRHLRAYYSCRGSFATHCDSRPVLDVYLSRCQLDVLWSRERGTFPFTRPEIQHYIELAPITLCALRMLRMQVCEKAYMRYLEWVRMLGDDCSDSPSVATFGMLGALLHPRFITRVVPVGIGSAALQSTRQASWQKQQSSTPRRSRTHPTQCDEARLAFLAPESSAALKEIPQFTERDAFST
jgi:hypothetical protein